MSSDAPDRRAPLRPANLVSFARDEIHRRIMIGDLAEGAKIVLGDMARDLGVSMIPVREALARLSAERLVVYEPNKGFRVAPGPDAAEIANLFEARLILEIGAMEMGLAQMRPVDLAELRAINDQIRAQTYGARFEDFQGFITLNARFHAIIVGLPGNPLVTDAYDRLGYHERIPLTMHGKGVRDVTQIVAEHDAIIAAMADGSLDRAREALKAHILDAYDRLPIAAEGHSLRPLKASMPLR
jgi:DNA-binding GntR family transcriptional regulator